MDIKVERIQNPMWAVKVSDLLNAVEHDWSSLPDWIIKAHDKGDVVFERDSIRIREVEGTPTTYPGDWIIYYSGQLEMVKEPEFTKYYRVI